MDHEARCAFVHAQAACVIAMTAAMQAQNQLVMSQGQPPMYAEADFEVLIDRYGIGHNAVITYLANG